MASNIHSSETEEKTSLSEQGIDSNDMDSSTAATMEHSTFTSAIPATEPTITTQGEAMMPIGKKYEPLFSNSRSWTTVATSIVKGDTVTDTIFSSTIDPKTLKRSVMAATYSSAKTSNESYFVKVTCSSDVKAEPYVPQAVSDLEWTAKQIASNYGMNKPATPNVAAHLPDPQNDFLASENRSLPVMTSNRTAGPIRVKGAQTPRAASFRQVTNRRAPAIPMRKYQP